MISRNLPKQLILDYSKWRCGGYGQFKLGKGLTTLLNVEGFMCCLGMFCQQSGMSNRVLIEAGNPQVLPEAPIELANPENTHFTYRAIEINDNEQTNPEYKIEQLTKLCQEKGFELRVINKPS